MLVTGAAMRILLFSGKGGVGKTSLAAATGLKLAELGYRTVVMSIDPAHSLGDSFDLQTDLFHLQTADPLPINDKLPLSLSSTSRKRSNATGRKFRPTSHPSCAPRVSSGVEAEELAILPGMEELSGMMHINQYRREQSYDVIVLDAAPTAESLRFISMPTTLDWYMKHIFPFQRNLLKAVRPIANRVAPFELPADSYFANIRSLFERLEGADDLDGRSGASPAFAWSRIPEKNGVARDAARLCLLLVARPHGRHRHRESALAQRRHRYLVWRMAKVAIGSPSRDGRIFRAGSREARAPVRARSSPASSGSLELFPFALSRLRRPVGC